MAQVLRDSVVGYPEALAIFDKPIQNVGVRKYRCIDYYPVNDFTTQGVIQFSVPGNGNGYLDLSKTILNIRCKIVRRDGSDIPDYSQLLFNHNGKNTPPGKAFDDAAGTVRPGGGEKAAHSPGPQPGQSPAPDGDNGVTPNPPEKHNQNDPPEGTRGRRDHQRNLQKAPENGLIQNDANNAGNGSNSVSDDREQQITTGMVGVANNFLNTMFGRIDASLQNKLLTESDNSYPYQSYFKALFYTNQEVKNSSLQTQLYYNDDLHTQEDMSWAFSENKGYFTRSRFFDGSREVDLCGQLYCDIFEITKFIPNGVSLNVVLYPNLPEFCLLSSDVNPPPDYKVIVTKASLTVCNVEVSPEIIAAHSEIMQTEPATYTYSKSEIKKFTLTRGMYSAELNDPFNGRVPVEVIIGLVSGKASHGDYGSNPFTFLNKKVNFVQITVDGQDMSGAALETKFGPTPQESLYIRAYKSLNGVDGSENGNPINRLDYHHGNCFYRFVSDHTETDYREEVTPLKRTGNVRVCIRFDEMLDETTTVILFAKFAAGIKIDKNRAVFEM